MYLRFEASFLLSYFFHLFFAFGRSFHPSSCSEINLSLDVFLTTEGDLGLPPDRLAKGIGRRRERREMVGARTVKRERAGNAVSSDGGRA